MITPAPYQPAMRRALGFLLYFIFCSLLAAPPALAQHKPGYSLLWRISGKDLKQPSYLFGTMHVKDKRVFDFSDSVMLAIRKCDAFALEVHPDTLVSALFTEMRKPDTAHSIRKMLSKEQYDKLARRYREKKGAKLDDDVSPLMLESYLEKEESKPDDKQTFVDAYLYGIARTLHKNILGLERAADQLNNYNDQEDMKATLDALADDADGSMGSSGKENLIKIYSTGNLRLISKALLDDDAFDSLLVLRNHIMLNSMRRHMQAQATFTAVGVAHLPGPNGLIELLRSSGYTVEPVMASFTGIASQYTIDYNRINWPAYSDKAMGYTVAMPGEPIKNTRMFGFETVLYPDMANGVVYGMFATQSGSKEHPVTADEAIQQMLKMYKSSQSTRVLKQTAVTVGGQKGANLILKTDDNYLRMQLVFKNNRLYCQYMGNQLKDLYQPFANHFFQSLELYPPAEKPAHAWVNYRNGAGAFSVSLPAEPKDILNDLPDSVRKKGIQYQMHLLAATSQENQTIYLVRYNNYPPGTYLAHPDRVFAGVADEFKAKGEVIGMPEPVYKDGYEGRKLRVKLNNAGGYIMDVQFFIRGNRTYVLLRQSYGPAQTDVKDNFFDSFTLLPYHRSDYLNYQPLDSAFAVRLPGTPLIKPDSADASDSYLQHTINYSSSDDNSGNVYSVVQATLSKYYRSPNMDSLYNKLVKDFTAETDTLLKQEAVSQNNLRGVEWLTRDKSSAVERRRRIFVDHDRMYLLASHVSKEELNGEANAAFFNSFRLVPVKSDYQLQSSKAALIQAGLLLQDTTESKKAAGALSYYRFMPDELPVVYQMLNHAYPDDTSASGVRSTLIVKLAKLHDTQAATQLAGLYANPAAPDELKATILHRLPEIDTLQGYNTYLRLLTQQPPAGIKNAYRVFSPLQDSLGFAAAHFEQLKPLLKYPELRRNMLALALALVDEEEGPKYRQLITRSFKDLTAYADRDLRLYLSETDTATHYVYTGVNYYLDLMDNIKGQPLTDRFTRQLISTYPNSYYLYSAVSARLDNGLPVGQPIISKLLADMGTRYKTLTLLNRRRMLGRVPPKYLKQGEFARLCLYEYIADGDEDDAPSDIRLLGSLPDHGSVYYAFSYKLGGDDKTYIGIAGPYKPGAAKPDIENWHAYAPGKSMEVNWRLQTRQLIAGYKKEQADKTE